MKVFFAIATLVFCGFSNASASNKWFCSSSSFNFQDSQGNNLYKADYSVTNKGRFRLIEIQSLQDYLNAQASQATNCHRAFASCVLVFSADLNPTPGLVQASSISLADCLNKLETPLKLARICQKEYFSQPNLSSSRRLPLLGRVTIKSAHASNFSEFMSHAQSSQMQIDCRNL